MSLRSRRPGRRSLHEPFSKLALGELTRWSLEKNQSLLDVAHRHVGDVGGHRTVMEIAGYVLQFGVDRASNELGHDGRDVLDGVLAVEFVNGELTEHLCRFLFTATSEIVNHLRERAVTRESV